MAKTKLVTGQSTDNMRYNPLVKGGRMVDHYKELKYYAEFNPNTDVEEKLVRLAFMITDQNSPVSRITDFEIKIKEAVELIDLKAQQVVDEVLRSENDFFRKAITRCCILSNKYAYELWLSKVTAFNQFNYMLRMPVLNAKDPLKALETQQKIGSKLEEWMKDIMRTERQLFQDDYIKNAVYEESASRTIHFAEEFADIAETIV